MKLFMTLAAVLLIGSNASAQDANSASASQANNTANQISAAQSAAIINFPETPANTRNVTEYTGTYRVESAPAVSAPAVFGGGHPCLAGKSGGFSVIGGGLSYGQGNAEPACMAWVMGQPEVAIRIMMKRSPEFCEAMNDVGYYRVGNSVLPVECGRNKKIVRGGVDSANANVRTSRVSTRNSPVTSPKERPALWRECYLRDDGKIGIVLTSVGKANKQTAARACQQSLGY